jgi:cellulose synthase/poly-beta-1,6-N-acetylglucosamine synthase-like glycosyltransferase
MPGRTSAASTRSASTTTKVADVTRTERRETVLRRATRPDDIEDWIDREIASLLALTQREAANGANGGARRVSGRSFQLGLLTRPLGEVLGRARDAAGRRRRPRRPASAPHYVSEDSAPEEFAVDDWIDQEIASLRALAEREVANGAIEGASRSSGRSLQPGLWTRPLGQVLSGARDAAGRRRRPGRPVSEPHYVSADSVPEEFAVARPAALAPAFLLLFALVSAAQVPALPPLMRWYGEFVAGVARVPRWEVLAKGGSISFRPFFLVLIVLLSVFAVGSPARRLRLLLFGSASFIAAVFTMDVLLARTEGPLVPPFSQVGGLISGLVGLFVIVVTIFSCYELPPGIRVETRRRKPRRNMVLLASAVLGAVVLVAAFSLARQRYFDNFHIRFIGGLDSEIVLFLLATVCVLAFISGLDRMKKPMQGRLLTVAFLVPAYNEEAGIADCLRSIDACAARYGHRCSVYVVDNGSRDETSAVADRALAACSNVDGRLLMCPIRGKSHALNHGLSHIEDEVVIRIDADTHVEPSLLETMMPWYWNADVGGVGGLPLPKKTAPRWLYPLRLIEVYYGVAFLRTAQGAADLVLVMPGLIASYRRSLLEELGGFGEGFNGEDADITMRIGRLGYRIVTDPKVRVYTEVPETLAHFREQRQRWARGLFHMAGRNISSIWMRQGARALWNLPWSIFNAGRRSLMIPVLVCALTVELVSPSVFSLREVSVVAGFLVGLQLFVISVLLIVHGRFRVLPFVPGYILFRLLRAYIAFETILTLRLKGDWADGHEPLERQLEVVPEGVPVTPASAVDGLQLCRGWTLSPRARPVQGT